MNRTRFDLITDYQPRLGLDNSVWLKLALTESKALVIAKTKKIGDTYEYQLKTDNGQSYGNGAWYRRDQLSKR